MEIHLENFIYSDVRVISGRDKGAYARNQLNLDKQDKTDETIHVYIASYIYAMTSSFFLGCFGASVRKLGERGFKEKYIFKCDPVILKNIENDISYALKTSNVLAQP